MRAVVQRVIDCKVTVGGAITGQIAKGLLVYLGVGASDGERDLQYLVDKVASVRIFADAEGKMNLSVRDVGGQILVVSQFTLFGDVRKGRRPSYTDAARPGIAQVYYAEFIERLKAAGFVVASGKFAALMEVRYTNVGPVTLLIDSAS